MESTMDKKTTVATNPLKSTSDGNGGNSAPLKIHSTTSENPAVASSRHDPRHDDNKKLKRILASREYSQKYRLKQQQYVMQLEDRVKFLKDQIAIVSPKLKHMKSYNSMTKAKNASIKQRLSDLAGELTCKQAQHEELKKETEALKQLYAYQQQMIRNNNQNMNIRFGPACLDFRYHHDCN